MKPPKPNMRPTFETFSCKYIEVKQDGPEARMFAQFLKDKYPGLDELVYLKNDYELSKNNKSESVLGSHQMERTDSGFVIYKEYFDGIPLEKYLSTWTFNVPQFLNLAIKLTSVLKDLHQRNLIVKEFTIENILISPETLQLKVCSLGCASKLFRERLEYSSEFNYYGSLWHIAPEQTGRIGRSLDYRADFYSLGILLYQILCRRKPFFFADSLELIHAHIAKKPVEPKNIFEDIPDPINEIVMKLMSKNAEDRYQSDDGIINDLNHCLNEWKKTGKLDQFELGKNDFSSVFCISEKLYGRNEELAELNECWRRIKGNDSELFMVAGYSGIGKTRLINEIKKPIFQSNGFFISGKFDQLNRETPFSAFVGAISNLVQVLLAEPAEKLKEWQKVISDQTDENISRLCQLAPELTFLVGNQEEVVDLGPIEGKKRFNKAFLDFLSIFEIQKKPVVIYIDDLQWADYDSLDLLVTILTSKLKNVLLIGAYRDNEVDKSHPLTMRLNTLKADVPEKINQLFLKELTFDDINQLIADSFKLGTEATKPLTEVIMQKTRGNPFFVKQLLEKLVEEQIIAFDLETLAWIWKLDSIKNFELSDYVVDLLLKKIKKLPPKTQEVLSMAASIGNVFDIETLCFISSMDQKTMSDHLWECMNNDFISPIGQWVKHYSDEFWEDLDFVPKINYQFRFQHDRIQQAAYSMIPVSDREAKHYMIGKNLLSKLSEAELEENLFEVVNHINIGKSQTSSTDEKRSLAALNLKAAQKALKNNVIRPAFGFFKNGMDFLEGEQNVEIFKDLLIGQSECEYLLGNYDASEELFDKAIENSGSTLLQADILCRKMALYENTQRHEQAIDTARDGLKLLGVSLPQKATQFHVLKELATVKFLLRNKTTEQLLNHKPLESPEKILIMKILMNLWGPVYLLQKQELLALKILKMVNISVRHGNSIESALAYAFYGYVISAQLKDYKSGLQFAQLGMDLNAKLEDKSLRSKVIVIAEGCVAHWGRPGMELLPNLREAYNVGIESNDIIYAGYALTFINRLQFFGGESLQSIFQKMHGYFQFTSKINSVVSRHQLLTWARIVVDLLDVDAPESMFEDLTLDSDHHAYISGLNDEINLQLPLANYYSAKAFYHYILDEMDTSWDFAIKADPLMSSVVGLTEWAEQIIFKVLAQLSLSLEGKKFSGKERRKLSGHLKLMKQWSVSAPENYESKYLLAMAESRHLKNKLNEAEKYYDAAIEAGKKYATPYMVAICLERKAGFIKKQNDRRQYQKLIRQAMNEYYHWGAKRKVVTLQNQNSFLSKEGESQSTQTSNLSSSALDLQSILQAAQTLSGEVMLDQLLEKLLNILIKNAGAQNAYLIQLKSEVLYVEAQSRMKNGNICEVHSLVLENVPDISHKVVRKAYATKQLVIIDDITAEASLIIDEQTKNTNARSILCMPVLSKGEIIAIIYLDNHLSSHVFTTERLELLEILSGQIAISLENARHYQDMEIKVKERTQTIEQQKLELEESKQKSDELLLNILPEDIAEELKTNGFCRPKKYESVTIMFTDFVKFTRMSEKLAPVEIVEIVDHQYKAFDRIIEKHGIEKIKTIGDAYMCVSGLPKTSEDHAQRMVNAALDISGFVSDYIEERKAANLPWCDIRIGIHSGPVVAGVVGHNKFAFDIWGDSVNTASRIQSEAEPGKINISNTTFELVKEDFECQHRGKIKAKYKGEIDMYYITQ